MKRASALACCAALAACASAPDHHLPPSAAASLAIASVDPSAPRFEIAFKEKGLAAGSVVIENSGHLSHGVAILRGAKESCRVSEEFGALLTRITAVGTVDLADRGDEEIFLLNEDGGTGSHDEIMLLIDPRDCGVTGLTVTVFHQATHRTTPQAPLGRFDDLARRPERIFLNALKYRYGFVGKDDADRQEKNPEYAYYFWARDNGSLNDGRMKIRRYEGRPAFRDSLEASLMDGVRVYAAYFKGGVVAYDAATDEHFVLFHPQDMYAWPTLLQRAGPYLLVGTRGEGVAAIDLRDFRLRRFRFQSSDDVVKSLEVKGSEVIVNGVRTLKLPGL
ncbi:MAG: hypothetical protein HY077_18135 [Elusimicrobia bacterium]|nr:hypothetical protein [Elusimicrobiota bacterium]